MGLISNTFIILIVHRIGGLDNCKEKAGVSRVGVVSIGNFCIMKLRVELHSLSFLVLNFAMVFQS